MSIPTRQDIPKMLLEENPDSGYTYVIGKRPHYKIGYTKDIRRRLNELQIAHHKKLTLACYWVSCCPDVLEDELHKHFKTKRQRGEWYKLAREDIEQITAWSKSNTVPTCFDVEATL